jgi:hypothetical protein
MAEPNLVIEGAETAGEHALPALLGLTPPMWIALAMIAVFAIMIWKKVPARSEGARQEDRCDPRAACRSRSAAQGGRGAEVRICGQGRRCRERGGGDGRARPARGRQSLIEKARQDAKRSSSGEARWPRRRSPPKSARRSSSCARAAAPMRHPRRRPADRRARRREDRFSADRRGDQRTREALATSPACAGRRGALTPSSA